MTPTVHILYAPGTNCQRETADAFATAGARPVIVFLSDLLRGTTRLEDADIVCLPGGFSFGDHFGAGNITAWYLKTGLKDQLAALRALPVLCICNGFQVAARAGLFGPVSLAQNAHGTFHDEAAQRHIVTD